MVVAISFTGCKKDEVESEPEPTATTGTLKVKGEVKIGDASYDINTWGVTIALFSDDIQIVSEKFDTKGEVSFSNLAPGNYEIIGEGWVDDVDGDRYGVEGDSGIQIIAGDSKTVTIELQGDY